MPTRLPGAPDLDGTELQSDPTGRSRVDAELGVGSAAIREAERLGGTEVTAIVPGGPSGRPKWSAEHHVPTLRWARRAGLASVIRASLDAGERATDEFPRWSPS